MRLLEFTESNLDKLVSTWIEAWNPDETLKKILAYPESKKYTKPFGKDLYRVWTLPEEDIWTLQSNEPITLNPKSYISYSWTYDGAVAVTEEGYEHEGIRVYVKKTLQTPKDILFNVFQYAKENPNSREFDVMMAETEVILRGSPYYFHIDPSEILNIDD